MTLNIGRTRDKIRYYFKLFFFKNSFNSIFKIWSLFSKWVLLGANTFLIHEQLTNSMSNENVSALRHLGHVMTIEIIENKIEQTLKYRNKIIFIKMI